MSDHTPLKTARHQSFPDTNITDWLFLSDADCKWRLYYKPVEHSDTCNDDDTCQHGFYFYCVAWAGNYADDPMWSDETFIDTLYHGVALFDGLRHVYLGNDLDGIYGYTYYPDPSMHIEIWERLAELERNYCYDVIR